MAGTKTSGRPGGNPDIAKYAFTTDRVHPLVARLQLRISEPMMEQIKEIPDWQEWVRESIAMRLRRRKTEANRKRARRK